MNLEQVGDELRSGRRHVFGLVRCTRLETRGEAVCEEVIQGGGLWLRGVGVRWW